MVHAGTVRSDHVQHTMIIRHDQQVSFGLLASPLDRGQFDRVANAQAGIDDHGNEGLRIRAGCCSRDGVRVKP